MFKPGSRQAVYVCSAIMNNDLISEIVPASSQEEAGKFFEDSFKLKAKSILGPFLKKRLPKSQNNTAIKFNGIPRQAIYDGWIVNAFTLQEPANSAFLIFIKTTDSQSKQPPKGTTIVPIQHLRFL